MRNSHERNVTICMEYHAYVAECLLLAAYGRGKHAESESWKLIPYTRYYSSLMTFNKPNISQGVHSKSFRTNLRNMTVHGT